MNLAEFIERHKIIKPLALGFEHHLEHFGNKEYSESELAHQYEVFAGGKTQSPKLLDPGHKHSDDGHTHSVKEESKEQAQTVGPAQPKLKSKSKGVKK